jgi:HEPN domain-containing protein
MKNILAALTRYNIVGRYPETLGRAPSRAEAESKIKAARKVYEWLQERL